MKFLLAARVNGLACRAIRAHGRLHEEEKALNLPLLSGNDIINHLVSVTQNIYKAFEACPTLETGDIFLDLSKAFDRVWHKALLFKLKCNSKNGNLFSLIESYLADCKQRVPICAGVRKALS